MLKESIDLHRQGRLDEAELGYRNRLLEHPDDVDALHLLGLLRHQRGDGDEGLRLLRRAHALAPEDASIEASLAALHFRDGDHDAAATGYARALTLDPNLAGAHSGLGQIALLRDDRATAEEHFRIALRATEDAQALAGLGSLLLERGDAEGALRHLTRAADLAPEDAMVQLTMGRAFMQRGTFAFAERALENALRLQPALHPARHLLAAVLMRTQRHEEARAQFLELELAPDFAPLARIGVADSLRAEGRREEAIEAYRAAFAIDPAPRVAVRVLVGLLVELGRGEEALAEFDARHATGSGDAETRRGRADLLSMTGRTAEATDAWRALLAENPGDLQAQARVATFEELAGNFALAQAKAELVLRAVPDDVDMLLLAIRSALRSGDHAQARAHLDRLDTLPLPPSLSPLRWSYRGRAHDRAGEPAAALRCFLESQKGMPSGLPVLAAPSDELRSALAEAPQAAWSSAPILLLGAPGSGVERVAALLADQPGLHVLRDRFANTVRGDDFNLPQFGFYTGELAEADREALRDRYLAPLREAGVSMEHTIVDWLPRWDAALLALIRRAMPGTRLVIVERDPRDTLLNWIGFGWGPGFACPDPDAAAHWLARARAHLHYASELAEPARLVVNADALLADPAGNGAELARFIGVEALDAGAHLAAMAQGRGGLAAWFPAGAWQRYRDVLALPFHTVGAP